MEDWNINGNKVGSFYMAIVLNEVPGLKDIHTVDGKLVQRTDNNLTLVDGTQIGGLFYAKSVMMATGHAEGMTRTQKRRWLDRLNNTIAPSLQHVPHGNKASTVAVFGLFCGQVVHQTC
jgi:roadblock/LC7 domain-containing protein